MPSIHPRRCLGARFLTIAIAALCVCLAADSAFAQGGGLRRAGGGKKSDPKQPAAKQDKPMPVTPGNQTGSIIKFSPAKDKDLEKGIAGYLTVKPFEKNAKPLKLTIFKEGEDGESNPLVIKLGDHQFEDVEDYADVFWKGLYVTAGWGYKDENAKVKVKELRTVDFNSIEVKGKIDSIEEDVVVIRAVPKNDQDWPHLAAMGDSKPQNTKAGSLPKPKKVRNLKIKLKIVEDVSKLFDSESEETSLSSFEPGQAVEATIVYSSKLGMVVKLAPPGVSGNENAPKAPEDGGDKPAGGREGGNPRGRGPKGPVGGG